MDLLTYTMENGGKKGLRPYTIFSGLMAMKKA
jgi:hypothetical protein